MLQRSVWIRRALLMPLWGVVGCSPDPVQVDFDQPPLFSVVLTGTSPCPEDAPDCIPATGNEKEAMREALDMMVVEGNIWCQAAHAKMILALDNDMVDTFGDYVRYGWVHVKGSYNSSTGRISVNRGFVGGQMQGWWDTSQGNLASTMSHEAGFHGVMRLNHDIGTENT